MERRDLEGLCLRRKRQMGKLSEALDITNQIAAAADRRDEFSVELLLGEREFSIRALHETEQELRARLEELPPEDGARARALLRGDAVPEEEERELAEQAERYRRRLEALVAADRQLSLRLGGKRSFYNSYR